MIRAHDVREENGAKLIRVDITYPERPDDNHTIWEVECPRCEGVDMTNHEAVAIRAFEAHAAEPPDYVPTFTTATGQVLTKEDIATLADEAERGYEV